MRRVIDRVQRSLPMWLTAEDAVLALVGALPGSSADADVDRLKAMLHDDPNQLGEVASDLLLHHPATAQRHALPLLSRLIGVPRDRTYVAIGTHCFSASLLRRWGLRRWSGPFDWVFSSVPMVTHCIEDDFRDFLDRSLYAPVPIEQRRDGPTVNRVQHALFKQRFGVEYVFNHHDAHLDADHAYFTRCIERFRSCLKSDEPKVFVLTRTQGEGPAHDLIALRDALAQRCERFTLFAIDVPHRSAPRPLPGLEVTIEEPSLHACTLLPASHWEPLRFEDPIDEHAILRHIVLRTKRPD